MAAIAVAMAMAIQRFHRGQTSRAGFRFISRDFIHNELET